MFRLTIDHRRSRKSASPDELFDLGAGDRNCIDCAGRSGPIEELGYGCAIFVDAITGAHLPAIDVRTDEAACGPAALGFSPLAEEKYAVHPITGEHLDPRDCPLEIAPMISEDPIVADTTCGGPCSECAHSFMAYFDELRSETYCARIVSISTRLPLLVVDVRADEALCGPNGAWFELAPPMSPEDERILAQGGSTHFHW
jgi:hypothetical protein